MTDTGFNDSPDLYETDLYVESYHKQPGERLHRIVAVANLNKDEDVVDYACGSGLLLGLVYDKVKNYTGVDFSKKFISIAEKKEKVLYRC